MKIIEKIKKLFSNTYFNIALIFALAGLVLYFTLKNDGEAVIRTLKNVSVPGLIALIGLMVFERFLLGWGLASE